VRTLLVALLTATLQVPFAGSVDTPDAARPSFADFIAGVREEALARGLRPETVDKALATVDAPLDIVIKRDRTQAETVLTLEEYLSRRLTARFVARARTALDQQRTMVGDVAARYDVSPEILIAIWGLESNFGRFSGTRPTVAALATLAWDTRRPALFRSELFAALEILEHGDIEVSRMRGSWAGAMGQVQFMPSSFLKYAEDFDGDGRRDIWSSPGDVFASVANYLRAHAWPAGGRWGLEVELPDEASLRIARTVARRESGCRAKGDMTVELPLSEWQELGVKRRDGGDLPLDDPPASLVSGSTRHFLVHAAYDSLLDYNCSHAYAISVGLLADRLTASPVRTNQRSAPRPSSGHRHAPA